MKNTLNIKFFFAYAAIGLATLFLCLNLGVRFSNSYLRSNEFKQLYRHAKEISERYSSADGIMTTNLLYEKICSYAKGLDAEVWILNSSGEIILSSDEPINMEPTPTAFDPLDFGKGYGMLGDFHGMFSTPHLSVYAPLFYRFQTQGYVLIHEPESNLLVFQNPLLNIILTSVSITMAAYGLLVILFHHLVHKPLKDLAASIQEYAKGNLSHKTPKRRRDEFGYLADALNDMSARLSQTEQDQKKFLANVSHDFRSPLTSIKGYLEAILDGTIPPELQNKYLKIVLDETSRLTKLTGNMLALNTFSINGAYLDITSFDINHEIRKVIASTEGLCQEKGITFDLIQSAPTLMVSADVQRIQQVLYNLIDNAIKFSHRDGIITIRTGSRHGTAFISIKDNGCGISKENLNKIWERFYKTDSSRGKDKKGTGLGLSIVKEIIKAHDTNIDVISTEGVGTEFVFQLKLSEPSD